MNSISSPLSEIQDDMNAVINNELSKKQFLKKYGHLRPGTYDITINRYDKTPEFLKNLNVKKPPKIKLQTKNIDDILKKHGLVFDEIKFFEFVEKTIYLREKSKFEFTKSLSDAIELIAEAGKEIGFSREQLSQLSLTDIMKYKIMNKKELSLFWERKILKNKKRREIDSHLEYHQNFFHKMIF